MTSTKLPLGMSKNVAAGAILGVAILIFVILKATKPDAQVQTNAEPIFSVRTIAVTPASMSPSLPLYGMAVAPGRARMTAAISADVSAVHALAGDRVRAGDLVIELDAAEAEIAVTQARANMQQAEAQLLLDASSRSTNRAALNTETELLTLAERAVTRAVQLRQQGALSEAELDATKQNLQRQKLAVDGRSLAVQQADALTRQLRSKVSSAEAQMQRAELDLMRTQVLAPFDAAVVSTTVAVGDRVSPGQVLIDLYDTHQVEVRAQIPNRYLKPLQRALDQSLPVEAIATYNGVNLAAHFTRLAASGGGGGQDAYFRVDSTILAVDANVSLVLKLPAEDQAVALPFNAVYDLSRIFRVRDGRLESLEIEKLGDYHPEGGTPAGTPQQLLVRAAELVAGDEIIINQLPNAMTGLKVQTILQ